jgi:acylphosphatase
MTQPEEDARAEVIVRGRVQGVYFRASAVNEARALGLSGWVMNCPDGSVQAIAEGPRAKLDRFIAWCHAGPPGARVAAVDVQWQAPEHRLRGFEIRR